MASINPSTRLLPLHSPSTSAHPDLKRLPRRPDLFPSDNPFKDVTDKLGDWSVQTVVFPAAYPRTIVSPSVSTENRSTSRRSREDVIRDIDTLWANTRDAPTRTEASTQHQSDESQLWIAANRYYSSKRKSGVTLVFSHANGMHKETWEPLVSHLLNGSSVYEIWSLDAVNQGDSALLNGDNLAQYFDWIDHGRDIAQFLLTYLPPPASSLGHEPVILSPQPFPNDNVANLDGKTQNAIASGRTWRNRKVVLIGHSLGGGGSATAASALPTLLAGLILVDPVIPQPFPNDNVANLDGKTQNAIASGRTWRNRKVVLIGHSLGGGGSATAASALPTLLAGLILVDPVISPPSFDRARSLSNLAIGALGRRDTWANKEEALTSFSKNATFFGRWDSAVLARYVECALLQESDRVVLKCAKEQEAAVFVDPRRRSSHVYERLRTADKSSMPRTHIIFADVGKSVIPEPYIDDMCRELDYASTERVEGSGHLIVQERPYELAMAIARIVDPKLSKM